MAESLRHSHVLTHYLCVQVYATAQQFAEAGASSLWLAVSEDNTALVTEYRILPVAQVAEALGVLRFDYDSSLLVRLCLSRIGLRLTKSSS